MRVVSLIFIAALVALAAGTGASFATTTNKPSDAPKSVDEASSPPCHAYEQNPDGSWKQLACQEDGMKPQPASRISTRDAGKATR